MGLFSGQFANVVEWEEYRDDIIFWKWSNKEIKKGSKLVIRPGQDAIFLYNGKREGIFTDEGSFDIESEILPFLSSLKGFKFGFNSGLRAEVLFVNTKEFTIKWGTKKAINIPHEALPGGRVCGGEYRQSLYPGGHGDDRTFHRCGGDEQFPAGDHPGVPPEGKRDPEFYAGSSEPSSHHGSLCRGQEEYCQESDRRRLLRS